MARAQSRNAGAGAGAGAGDRIAEQGQKMAVKMEQLKIE
jgi:hypothetical protein